MGLSYIPNGNVCDLRCWGIKRRAQYHPEMLAGTSKKKKKIVIIRFCLIEI